MNKPFVFLRIAAVLTFIHAVLHTIGGVFGHVEPGPATVAVQANEDQPVSSCSAFTKFLGLLPRPRAGTHHLPNVGIGRVLAIGFVGQDSGAGHSADLDHLCGRVLGACREFVHLLFHRAGDCRDPHCSMPRRSNYYGHVSIDS